MSETIVILVNGEVLAGERGVTIPDQKENARKLAESLLPYPCQPAPGGLSCTAINLR